MVEKFAAIPKRVGKHNLYVLNSKDRQAMKEAARLRVSAANNGRKISDKILNQYAEKYKSLKRVSRNPLGITYAGYPHQTPVAFIYKDRIAISADKPINRFFIRGSKDKRYRKLLRNVVAHEKFHVDHPGKGIGKSEFLARTVGSLKSTKGKPNLLAVPGEHLKWLGGRLRKVLKWLK